jgi:hypothetical protein
MIVAPNLSAEEFQEFGGAQAAYLESQFPIQLLVRIGIFKADLGLVNAVGGYIMGHE